jgi:hypothetical protein
MRSRSSSVIIVPDYGLNDRAIGVRSVAEARAFFPLIAVSRPTLGPTQPPVQWVQGSKACPGRDADHSHPSSSEVINE